MGSDDSDNGDLSGVAGSGGVGRSYAGGRGDWVSGRGGVSDGKYRARKIGFRALLLLL